MLRGKWSLGGGARKTRSKRKDNYIELPIDILEIEGRKFVTGLHWQPLSSPLKYHSEAKKIGAERGWDVVAIRRSGGGIQAGFVSSTKGAYKGMYSIAAAMAGELSEAYGDKWLGLFALPDGRYLIAAVWAGMILSSADSVVTKEEAVAAFYEILHQYETQTEKFPRKSLFAPPEFMLADKEIKLEEIFGGKRSLRKEYRLTALKFTLTPAEVRILIVCSLLLAAGFVAFEQWESHRKAVVEQAEQEAAARRQAALAAANANARKKLEEEALRHPWALLPSAEDFALACYQPISKMPLNIAGWDFASATCSGGTLKLTYSAAVGTTQAGFGISVGKALAALAHEEGLPMVGFTDNGESATIELPITVPVAGDDALLSKYEAHSKFFASLQPVNSEDMKVIDNLAVSEVPVVITMPPLSPGMPPPPAPEATWRRFSYSFKSQLPPDDLFKGMQLKQGLRIASIETTLDSKEATLLWTVSGDMYVQR